MKAESSIKKYHAPTQFDYAPYGTYWVSLKNEECPESYIQVSHDEKAPVWEKLGEFLERAFIHELSQSDFLDHCLLLYEKNKSESLKKQNNVLI